MKRFEILTIFPEMIEGYVNESILGRAQRAKLIDIHAHNLRHFSDDKHKKVDDTPYGGGPGMVMTVQPFDAAVRKIKKRTKKTRVILTSPSGKRFTQKDAVRLSKYDQLIFLCGRYEGIDQRVTDEIADECLSIGDYVLTGGELAAMTMTDAIARLVPGVLGASDSLKEESHSTDGQLEYPQYTKPEVYTMRKGLSKKKLTVPPVLLSGNHKEIEKWRKEHSEKRSQT